MCMDFWLIPVYKSLEGGISMAVIIVPAAIIAALILFRWARTLLIFGIAALVIFQMLGHEPDHQTRHRSSHSSATQS